MEGRGRGGRGTRLMEALKQRQQAREIGVSGDEPPKEEMTASAPSPLEPSQGGRGRILRAIANRPSPSQILAQTERGASPQEESPSSATSSGSDQPSPSGAVSSPPREGMEQLTLTQSERRAYPSQPNPIMNKLRGIDGKKINVATNYVMIKVTEGMGIFEYHVSYVPNIDSRLLRTKILREKCSALIGNVLQFTGMNLYLPKRLDNDETIIETVMPHDPNTAVTVTIQYVKIAPFHELIPFYNTLFRRIMQSLKLVQIQRHYFIPSARIEVPQHKLEIWPGYVTAIHELDGGLLLNCDASHRILRTNTARDALQEIMRSPDGRSRFRDLAQKKLVGCVILTRYNNRPYRIDDIAFDQNPRSTFINSEGIAISYIDYFKKSWDIEIKDEKQPLLIHRPKPMKGETESRMICLIPELSTMTGLTDDIRSDFRAMRDIASHTRIRPEMRQQKLQQFIDNVYANAEAKKHLTDWGLILERKPFMTEARVMAPDKIVFGSDRSTAVNPKCDWTREVTSTSLFRAISIERWVLVYNKRDSAKAEDFVKTIKQVSISMGISLADPRRIEAKDESAIAYVNAIKEMHHPSDQIMVLLTPGSSQREDRYNAIKRLCCCDMPIPSQVIRANTIDDRKMRSVCQKIAIQMNCKIGGQPWAIPIPFKSCMIVGIDVYHDSAQKGKSVVGVVASINGAVTRWYTRVYFQNTHEEIVNTLETAIVSAIQKYYDMNHTLPQKIFIYRDGVSDGQLGLVRDYEIVQIENAILDYAKAFSDYKPQVTMVIVQKNINTKVLMKGNNEMDNPPPGSVLDHSITRKNYYDFYLISQFVNQGTVTPTHYIVIYDKNDMTPDRMQKLSYKMTHLYYNWPGTIRVPAPCQYAHKAAYLIGQNVRKAPAEELCDKLFFL